MDQCFCFFKTAILTFKFTIYSFGLVANGFELIPIIGTIFHFSNTVAGALWAAEIEKNERQRLGMNRAIGQEKIRKMVTGFTY